MTTSPRRCAIIRVLRNRFKLVAACVLVLAAWQLAHSVGAVASSASAIEDARIITPPLPRLSPFDSSRLHDTACRLTAAAASTKPKQLAPFGKTKTAIVTFANSPFPYDGVIPDTGMPFLDVSEGGRRGHSGRDGVYWDDETYCDRSVLLSLPGSFDLHRPAIMVVFFHGNQATLERDVVERQRVVDQFVASGLNAVLVAPQFAHDAPDSSAGNFWRPGFFALFLNEAATDLAKLYGSPRSFSAFDRLPVVLVAYSGGYAAAGYALAVGGAAKRVYGLVLLDALYGEEDKFVDWITQYERAAFFFSAYSRSSTSGNIEAEAALKAHHVQVRESPPAHFTPGTVTFLATNPQVTHYDFMTEAWVRFPLQWLLQRMPGYFVRGPGVLH